MTQKKIKLSREEQAKREVGRTEISRRLALVLVVAFLFTIYSVPVIQQVIDRRKAAANQTVQSTGESILDSMKPAGMMSLQGLMSINATLLKRISLYQEHLDDTIFLTRALNPALQSLVTGWLKGGNEQAYCGLGQWLFYRPDVEYLTGRGFLDPQVLEDRSKSGGEWQTPPQPDPVKALKQFRDQLGERNIELIVMPVPSKPMIYPDKYSARYEGATERLQNASFDDFLHRLDTEGIACFDPAPLLLKARGDDKNLLYLQCDTHWTPLGMRLVAGALADHIRAMKVLSDQPDVPYRQVTMEITNLGDIAKMLKLPEDQDFYQQETVTIEKVMQRDGQPWRPDPNAEILFLGDSFSNIYSLDGMGWGECAGFVETLSANLGRPVDRIVINDNGSYATRRILSREERRGADRLAGKRLLIYEFAVRELSKGDWKTDLDLTPVTGMIGGGDAEAIAPSGKIAGSGTQGNTGVEIPADGWIVTGTIEAITKVPSPGTVPYKDCILSFHLTGIQSDPGSPVVDEALVYVWGMRENQLTDNATLSPGQSVTVRLVPWDVVQDRYGSYNRQELDDDSLLFLDAYWWPSEGDKKMDLPADTQPVADLATPGSVASGNPDGKTPESSTKSDSLVTFIDVLKRIVDELETAQKNTWQGRDGWLFFGPELRSLTVGHFWGERAAEVSRAMNPKYADPLPAIVDFNEQLKKAGIDLWVVPVPQKASIYPEMINDQLSELTTGDGTRYDGNLREFYDLLKSSGVRVVDLYPLFVAHKTDGAPLYCCQDTHWSGRAIKLTARELARQVKALGWYDSVPKTQYQLSQRDIEITGDLWKSLGNDSLVKETLSLAFVSDPASGDNGVPDWRESPVLLLGDSHNLVFHIGQDLFAKGAGFPDHLANELGFAVDLEAVRGSGATPARINLMRRKDNLAGKKLVIWCFTARDFSETTDGWRNVPIIR